jgi:cytidylate kinase
VRLQSADQPRPRLITVSATYGAGGSLLAPRLAEQLGLPFLDRLIPPVAGIHAANSGECVSAEERAQTPVSRLIANLVRLPSVVGTPVHEAGDIPDRGQLRLEAERSIGQVASRAGGVILGRAAAVVLAGHPSAFHVRLDGPEDRRVARAMAIEQVDERTARQRQAQTDRVRALYVQRLYDRDPADAHLYHLVVDSTVLALDTCVELVATAACAFWDRLDGPSA